MPEVKKLKIEKEMYAEAAGKGLSLTQFLETLEPGPANAKLDAFEQQMKAYGLKVSGHEISLVEDFYKTTSSKALFPEFINRNVRLGMEMGRNECQLSDLVATEIQIPSMSYAAFSAASDAGEKGAFRVGQAASFPTTTITLADKSITLAKVGHKFSATYEVIRRQTVDQLAVHLKLIGRKLRKNMVAWALDTIVNGDGNSNPASVFDQPTLDYDDMVDFDAEFTDFAAMVWVATKAGITAILKLAEMKDPQAGFNYQRTGNMVTPFGITLRRHDDVAANSIIAVDKGFALEKITEAGSNLVETDRVIDKQLEDATISQNIGFSKIYTDASMVWDYTND
jgi:hypothetical protein